MTNNVGFWISIVALIGGAALVGGLYVDRALTPICQDQDTGEIKERYAQCMTNRTGSALACADKAERLACKRWAR